MIYTTLISLCFVVVVPLVHSQGVWYNTLLVAYCISSNCYKSDLSPWKRSNWIGSLTLSTMVALKQYPIPFNKYIIDILCSMFMFLPMFRLAPIFYTSLFANIGT